MRGYQFRLASKAVGSSAFGLFLLILGGIALFVAIRSGSTMVIIGFLIALVWACSFGGKSKGKGRK
jgi:hypothetical protein